MRTIVWIAILAAWLLVGCGPATTTPTPIPVPSQPQPTIDGLTNAEIKSLESLAQVDDYPLCTLHYYGSYSQRLSSRQSISVAEAVRTAARPAWGCSLFAALGDVDHMLFGRNFDWDYSPAVLLFTEPPDGYTSVSMVDLVYLDFTPDQASHLLDLPLAERQALLDAPRLPFDGMNERGLVVGMAAVPSGDVTPDPSKETTGSIGVMRKMLDQAGTVDEAVAILRSYNIDAGGGPPIHYLIADASGRASLAEFYRGELVVTPNRQPWHLATNFLLASVAEDPAGECWRYDMIPSTSG